MKQDYFDVGFRNLMYSAFEFERLKAQEKPIPKELQQRLDKAIDWVQGLSSDDYSRLIH